MTVQRQLAFKVELVLNVNLETFTNMTNGDRAQRSDVVVVPVQACRQPGVRFVLAKYRARCDQRRTEKTDPHR